MIVLIAEATLVTIVGLGVVFMFAIPQIGIGSIQHVEENFEIDEKYAYEISGEPKLYSYGDHSFGRDIADCIASYRNFLDRAIRTVSGQVVA